jgi:predicted flap endonuclease-1-like 5' DNA nuclease
MMNNLSQSFLCLLAAAGLGLLFGWWLRRHLARNQLNEVKLSSQRVIADERARYAQLDEQLARAAGESDGLRQQLNAATNASLDSRRKHELELAQLRAQETSAATTQESSSETLRELENLRESNAKKLNDLQIARQESQQIASRLFEVDKRFSAQQLELNRLLEQAQAAPVDQDVLGKVQLELTQAGLQVVDLERRLQDAQLQQQSGREQQQQAHQIEMEKLRTQLAGRNADLEKLTAESNDMRADFAALRVHVAQRDQLLDKAKSELDSMTAQLESAKRELGERDARLSQLQMVCANHDIELASARNDLTVKDSLFTELQFSSQVRLGEIDRLREELTRREQTLLERQTIVAQYEAEVARLMALQESTAAREQALIAENAEERAHWEGRLEELRRRAVLAEEETQRTADAWKEANDALAMARTDAKSVRAELQAAVEQRQGSLLQLDTLRAEHQANKRQLELAISAAQEASQKQVSAMRFEYDEQQARLMEYANGLKLQLDELQHRPKLPAWRATRPREIDDLQLIWGVGPKLERLLHSLGIWTFRQIAGWTRKDIEEVDQELQVFNGRIDRDGWVASAKEEHLKKYGEAL